MPRIRIYQIRQGMHIEQMSSNISRNLIDQIENYLARMKGHQKGKLCYEVKSPMLDAIVRDIKKMGRVKFVERKAWRVN